MERLPEDIHYIVLDHLADDPSQLLESAYVSRAWLNYSRRLYGARYTFRMLVSMPQRPSLAMDVLTSPLCTLRKHVRHLRMLGPEVTPSHSVIREPLLQLYMTLHREILQIPDVFAQLSSLTFYYVNWSNWPRSSYSQLMEALSAGNRLKSLAFAKSKFNDYQAMLLFASRFPELEVLSIKGGAVMDDRVPLSDASFDFFHLDKLVLKTMYQSQHLLLQSFLNRPMNITSLAISDTWHHDKLGSLNDLLEHLGSTLLHLKFGLTEWDLDDSTPLNLEHNTRLTSLKVGVFPLTASNPSKMRWLLHSIRSISSSRFGHVHLKFMQGFLDQGGDVNAWKDYFDWQGLERTLLAHQSDLAIPLVDCRFHGPQNPQLVRCVADWLPTMHSKGKLSISMVDDIYG